MFFLGACHHYFLPLLHSHFSSKQYSSVACLVCGTSLERVLESHTETSPVCLQNKEKSNSAQPCEEPDIWLVWSCMPPPPRPGLQLLYPSPSGCSVFELSLTQNLARSCETDQVPCHGSLYFGQEYFFGISNDTGHFLEVHSKDCLNTSALCGHGNCILSSPHKNPVTNRPYTYYFPD